jgi:hypothetical protein
MARNSRYLAAGVALCGVLSCAVPAVAQLAPNGSSFAVATTPVRGTASAYDFKNNYYLAVAAYGPVMGRLVRPDGTFASLAFQIDLGTGFSHYPAVAYSPHADGGRGAYLVAWHSNVGNANLVHTRLVSATGTLLGAEALLGGEATWWEAAPNVAYASGSQVFMVTWQTFGTYQIRASRVNLAGQNMDVADPRGIVVTTTGGERDPSIAYNPDTDKFLISYADFLGGSHVYGRLVTASTGAVAGPQLLGASTATYITDSTYSSSAHQYVVGWYQSPGGPTARLVNADGTPAGVPIPLPARFGTYDSFGIAYSAGAQSSVFVGHDTMSVENGGAQLSDAGVPGPATVLTNAAGSGNFYPKISGSSTEARWMLTTAHNFGALVAQFATAGPAGPVITPTVTPTKPVRNDIDGDRKADPILWNANTGVWTWQNSSTTSTTQSSTMSGIQWGNQSLGDQALSGDIDGDGVTDLITWRASTGTWYWLLSSLGYDTNQFGQKQWGNISLGDWPLLADIDGDRKSDLIVWRASTGTWFWLLSSTNYSYASYGLRQWGNGSLGDIPLAGDFDTDGKADLAVWRSSTGTWYWLTSSTGYDYAQSNLRQWGNATFGDQPMLGDLDGDGRSELVIWRPTSGTWYWLTSGSTYTGAAGIQWGNQSMGDIPLLADFDGDGRADLTVWRSSSATWYWLPSSKGFAYAQSGAKVFGTAGDIPIK